MKTLSKALAGTVAAGAMALASANPAMARDRDRDGIGAGEIIAGAVILGGIAAIASASNKDRYRDGRYDDYRYRNGRYNGHYRDSRYYDDNRYKRRGNSQRAIRRCVNAVQRDARRAGYRFAEVTEIRDVDRERRGWEVRGRMVVDGGRGYGDFRRGDSGRFTCDISRGRVVNLDYRGIRGLR